MAIWKVNTSNEITIVTEADVDLKAYYILESAQNNNYVEILGSWAVYGDRRILWHTFDNPDNYILKIIDLNGNMTPQHGRIEVKTELISEAINDVHSEVWNSGERELTSNNANIVSVRGVEVTSIEDFKAGAGIIDIPGMVEGILTANINIHTAVNTIGAAFKRMEFQEAFVWVDTDLIINGDGTQHNPFNNVNDAKDLIEATGINNIYVSGDFDVIANLKNMNIFGIGMPKINLNGMDMKNTKFVNVRLQGTYTDSIIAQECVLLDGLTLNGYFNNCALEDTLYCATSAFVLMAGCYSHIPGTDRPFVSMNSGTATKLGIRDYSGGLTIIDSDHVDDECTIEVAQGSLTFGATCTEGIMVARGVCKFVDETTGATVYDETIWQDTIYAATMDLSGIATDVWTYATRELTQVGALTVEQAQQLSDIISNTTDIDLQVWTSGTRDLTDQSADIISVNGVLVTNIDDFRAIADTSTLETKIDIIQATVDNLENFDETNLVNLINALKTLETDERAALFALANYDDSILITKVNVIDGNVQALENYDDTLLTAKVEATKVVSDDIKLLVQALENYDDSTVITLINAIKTLELDERTKLMSLVNYDDLSLKQKIDATNLLIEENINYDDTILITKVSAIEGTVNSLENYDDTALVVLINAIKTLEIDERDKLFSLINYDDATLTSIVQALETLKPDERTKLLSLINYDDTSIQTKLDNLGSEQFGLTTEQHDKLMQLVNYDDKQLKNLAYAILGA